MIVAQVLLLGLLIVCWQIFRLLKLIVESWYLDGAPGRKKKIKKLMKLSDKLHEDTMASLASGRPTTEIEQREKEVKEQLDDLFETQELYAPCRNGVLIGVLKNLMEIKKLLEAQRAGA